MFQPSGSTFLSGCPASWSNADEQFFQMDHGSAQTHFLGLKEISTMLQGMSSWCLCCCILIELGNKLENSHHLHEPFLTDGDSLSATRAVGLGGCLQHLMVWF